MSEPAKKRMDSQESSARILAIDDDPSVAETIQLLLDVSGYEAVIANSGQSGWERFNSDEFDLVITDLRLPDTDGTELVRSMFAANPDVPIIMMTAYSSVGSAVTALRNGAVDYVIKPFNNNDFFQSIERALTERRILASHAAADLTEDDADRATSLLGMSPGIPGLLGVSPAIQHVHRLVRKVAPSNANVLIQGESGTGKDIVAQEIHNASKRSAGPFVPVNCGAIPSTLIESELFGHAKGAYTGATSTTEGMIREANGGTLFLDEIGTLNIDLQVKLLRVLQEHRVRPLGGKRSYALDVRFIAASNQDLKQALSKGTFREDLYYRLNVINIKVPALRERKGDVELLAQHYLKKYAQEHGREIIGMRTDLKEFLYNYHWPGNVRELQNLIERAAILSEEDHLTLQSIYETESDAITFDDNVVEAALSRKLSLQEYAKEFVRRYQDQHTETELASMLGIGRKALWMRRKNWGLYRPKNSKDQKDSD